MTYRIEIQRDAKKELAALDKPVRERVLRAIRALADDPRPAGCKKLVGLERAWRVRVGSYRIVYEITDETLLVLVIAVAHRREVYR
jgi:mRNA interferase RelE/StbE